MAKGKHSTNGRDSGGQGYGVKIFGGQAISAGAIIVKQRGTTFLPGLNTGMGSDHTIFSKIDGIVKFTTKKGNRKHISVVQQA